jgi:hypothetical protein
MKHYRLDTYHGPLVLTQRSVDWSVESLDFGPEVYPGDIPFWCLSRASEITPLEARRLVATRETADCGWTYSRDIARQIPT